MPTKMNPMEQAPEIIDVVIFKDKNGMSAVATMHPHKGVTFKIQEIMLGAGSNRKAVPYTKFFLSPHTECRAEILENGKLRIV